MPVRRREAKPPYRYEELLRRFRTPQAAAQAELDPVARFLYSVRAVILVISVQAALIAGLLAPADRHFDPIGL